MTTDKSTGSFFLAITIVAKILLFSASCTMSHNYPGFTKTDSGIYYRLNVIGEGERTPSPGDFITVDIKYSTVDDSVFFRARRKFMLEKPGFLGSVEECFGMLHSGDEADFIIDANSFFTVTLDSSLPGFIEKGDPVMISVKMLDIQTMQSYYEEREAFMAWLEDFGKYEKRLLENYIINNKLDIEPDSHGLYFLQLREGTGQGINAGDMVELHYEGRFINGRYFDSTYNRGETFRFIYGHEWQLLKGLEKAVGQMSEGEKALVFLPSELAYGNHGSSTGIVPPYTSLIYEIEIVRVN